MNAQADTQSGPLVGTVLLGNEVRLPESAVQEHVLLLGEPGVGKTTLLQRILAHRFEQGQGGAVVVLDPNGDLVRGALRLVPSGLAARVRFLDFGCPDQVPALNLLDPSMFPDRERCVGGLVRTLRHLWAHWGLGMEDVLTRTLSLLYEYNRDARVSGGEMLPFLDAGRFLLEVQDGGGFPAHVLSRVTDRDLLQWADAFVRWDHEARAKVVAACGPLMACRSDSRISAVLGQSRSRVDMSRAFDEGLILLFSTSRGPLGQVVSALVGGAVVEAMEVALRRRSGARPSDRGAGPGCILMCDDFRGLPGVDWERVVSGAQDLGCSVMLAAQTLDKFGFWQKEFVGRFGVVLGYRMMSGDAGLVAGHAGCLDVEARHLEQLGPHRCVVAVTAGGKSYPAFIMDTLGSPAAVGAGDAVLTASQAWTVPVEAERA